MHVTVEVVFLVVVDRLFSTPFILLLFSSPLSFYAIINWLLAGVVKHYVKTYQTRNKELTETGVHLITPRLFKEHPFSPLQWCH